MTKPISFLPLLLLFCLSCTGGCATANSSQFATRPSLESLREQFAPMPQPELQPLEEVRPILQEEGADHSTHRTYGISLGESAPFSGLLLSEGAAAYIVTEHQALQERYGVSLTQQRERDFARLLRETETLRLQVNGDRERFLILFESQERYTQDLERMLSNTQETSVVDILAYVGIGAAGVLIGIIVGFFAAN